MQRHYWCRPLAKSGQRAESVKLRDQLKSESTRGYAPNYMLAMASIALVEKDEAIALLEKDIADRGSYISLLAIDPAIDDLRDHPRFAALVKKVESSKLD